MDVFNLLTLHFILTSFKHFSIILISFRGRETFYFRLVLLGFYYLRFYGFGQIWISLVDMLLTPGSATVDRNGLIRIVVAREIDPAAWGRRGSKASPKRATGGGGLIIGVRQFVTAGHVLTDGRSSVRGVVPRALLWSSRARH